MFQFLFDLDSTVTKVETLPYVAQKLDPKGEITLELKRLTELSMNGSLSFSESFTQRVDMLKSLDVHLVRNTIAQVPLNEEIASFIKINRERCSIVTSNLSPWIAPLVESLGVNCYSSTARTNANHIEGIDHIIDKGSVVKSLNDPVVAIGDGANDCELLKNATIAIAFGGTREIPLKLLSVSDYAIYSEKTLCQMLKQLL